MSTLSNANEIMKMIDKIRQPIKEMSAENKAHTAKYVKNLSQISALYNLQS